MTTSTRQAANRQLVISPDTLGQIVAHLQSWLPYEGCGLIATECDRVVRLYLGENVARSKIFYEMDPKQVLHATREIEADGLRLGAIFHSHPTSAAYPSPTDLELIFDPDVYMMIVSFAGDDPDVRVFRYDGDIREVPIVMTSNDQEQAR